MLESQTPRIGLIGARRERQGLGPWFARRFEESGARIVAFAGRSPERLARTREDLERSLGHPVTGHVGIETMVAHCRAGGTPLDALVIASPIETHETALRIALREELHVLCEKPMIDERSHGVERARELVAAFDEQELRLWVHVQWPETLGCYDTLHPVVSTAPPRTFGMLLAPDSLGSGMLRDALHHPLSLLQARLPRRGARLENVRFERLDEAPWSTCEHLDVRFDFVTDEARVASHVRLTRQRTQPRPACYGFDGRFAHRAIVQPGYHQFLERYAASDDAPLHKPAEPPEHRLDLPDPMRSLVGAFVSTLCAPHASQDAATDVRTGAFECDRLSMLRTLTESYASLESDAP